MGYRFFKSTQSYSKEYTHDPKSIYAEENQDNSGDYIIDVPFDYPLNEKGLGFQLFSSMRKYRKLVAQYIADTEEEETYGDILVRCVRTAIHLQGRGLTKDDVVILCSHNHKYSCVPFIACLFLGIPVASLDPNLSLLDTRHLIKEVKPTIIFIVEASYDLIKSALKDAGIEAEIVVYGDLNNCTSFKVFLEEHADEENFVPSEIDSLQDTAIIVFSSGTTGLPKGIMLNHYAILGQTLIIANSGSVGTVFLTYASLYWISSILFLIACANTGAARVICERFSSKSLWSLIEKYHITGMFLAPIYAIHMIKVGRPEGLDTTSLWSVVIGGGATSEKHIKELRDLLPGTFVSQVYGQSEVGGILSVFRTNVVRETLLFHYRPTSVGLPIPGITYKVVDPETSRICGTNESGELRVKSKFVMNGYYNRDSSESFDSDGWLRTGDIVYYDEDYCFYIVDRIKEMLKYKSWHVPPAMIEQILVNHPAVANAVVIGIPHEEDGDHPMALIILNGGYHGNVTSEEIINFVADRVPERMQLRAGAKFVDKFPMTPSGKIKRKEMREMVLTGKI